MKLWLSAPSSARTIAVPFNRKGLIAEDKSTRKLAFDVLASYCRGMD